MIVSRTEFIILLALKTDSRYGGEIRDLVLDVSNGEIYWLPGTLYRALRALTKQGLIEIDAVRSTSSRQYCVITERGRQVLQENLDFYQRVQHYGQNTEVDQSGE